MVLVVMLKQTNVKTGMWPNIEHVSILNVPVYLYHKCIFILPHYNYLIWGHIYICFILYVKWLNKAVCISDDVQKNAFNNLGSFTYKKNISLQNFKILVRVLLQLLEGLQVYIKNYIINVRKLCFNWKGLNILKIKISSKIY